MVKPRRAFGAAGALLRRRSVSLRTGNSGSLVRLCQRPRAHQFFMSSPRRSRSRRQSGPGRSERRSPDCFDAQTPLAGDQGSLPAWRGEEGASSRSPACTSLDAFVATGESDPRARLTCRFALDPGFGPGAPRLGRRGDQHGAFASAEAVKAHCCCSTISKRWHFGRMFDQAVLPR